MYFLLSALIISYRPNLPRLYAIKQPLEQTLATLATLVHVPHQLVELPASTGPTISMEETGAQVLPVSPPVVVNYRTT